eukprot:COSAG02_NODE_6846_length_3329_cov_6.995356_2_plen_125_part_00
MISLMAMGTFEHGMTSSSAVDWQQSAECGALSSDAALLAEHMQVAWTPVQLAATRRQPRCLQSLLHSLGAAATSRALRARSPAGGKNALHLCAELGSATQLSTILAYVDCSTGSAAIRASRFAC